MKKIKLLSILVASVASGSAFADCMMPATPYEAIHCATDSSKSLMSYVKSNANDVYSKNEALGTSIYDYFNTNGRASFNWNAAKQAVTYGIAAYKTTGPDLVNIGKTLSKGDLTSAPVLIGKFQDDRAALLASGSDTEFAAKAVVYAEIEAMAKLQLGKSGDKNSKLKVSNYASNMYYAYYAPAAVIAMYQFSQQQAPKYIGAAMNTMTQEMCEAQVATVQNNIQTLQQTDMTVDFLIENSKPGSFLKASLKSLKMNYATDAMDILYTYATGMSAEKKNTPYNICDYNAFKASANSNMYSKILNNTVVAASNKAGISAEKAYWGLTAISAISLDRGLVNQPAPIEGTGILPF